MQASRELYGTKLSSSLKSKMDAFRKLNQPVEFAMETTGIIHETKTDVTDAFIITEVVRIGRYSNTEILPEDIHALRELCRQRFYVIDMASDIKRKIIALLDQIFLEYEKLFSNTFGVTSLELLVNYQTTRTIKNDIPVQRP